ncbi:MAG: OmpA family protein [Leptolyngbya sp. SIO4C1]|nr:OmpA family protein [Leptolyngbya sp. SIO4C1]
MAGLAATLPLAAFAQNAPTLPASYSAVVTSAADGPISPDAVLTLREAIELVNGTLPFAALSPAEKALVTPAAGTSQISFNLVGDTNIQLGSLLPPLTASGLVIDGSTQPGYGGISTAPMIEPVPTPVVSISPAAGAEVPRGLTVTADDVTIRGLSLYGFSSRHRSTETTPPADIFITHLAPPIDAGPGAPSASALAFQEAAAAPAGVVVEDSWLGISPTGEVPDREEMSAFGVSVFNAVDPVIRRNRIEYHEGSGIITGARAQGMVVTENTLIANGLAGMPDAIRLDGDIDGTEIFGNLMCGSDGSGVYLFKPDGAARIYDNNIRFNGRRLRRAAVYLMGSGHEVTDNFIGYQPGPGVAIAAYPRSEQNLILNNQFAALDGLSVDLTYNHSANPYDYQIGDGPNPPRYSYNRRKDTANAAINAPTLTAYVFPLEGEQAVVTGTADPGSEVTLYTVNDPLRVYGALDEQLDTTSVGEDGQFSFTLGVPSGTRVSAIATDPRYGTSEPSPMASIGEVLPIQPAAYSATCALAQVPIEAEPELPPEPLQLSVPRQIHFALDQSFISAESADILDQVAAVLQEYSFIVIELEGHTDPRASNAYNQALGERRARSARDYLLQQGIAPERMRIRSFGETQRATTGSDRIDYARDRRVEIIFEDTRGLEIEYVNPETDLQLE